MQKLLILLILLVPTTVLCQAHNDTYEQGKVYKLDAFFVRECSFYENTLMIDPIFTQNGIMSGDSLTWEYTFKYNSPKSGLCQGVVLLNDSYYTFTIPESSSLTDAKAKINVRVFLAQNLVAKGEWDIEFCEEVK